MCDGDIFQLQVIIDCHHNNPFICAQASLLITKHSILPFRMQKIRLAFFIISTHQKGYHHTSMVAFFVGIISHATVLLLDHLQLVHQPPDQRLLACQLLARFFHQVGGCLAGVALVC